ncbi:MAG: lytic transglycosylase domain-containing protein [Vicinamibacterales bacterium]
MLKTLGATICLWLVSMPASAQIYSWRDEAGNLVVSDRAREGAVVMPSYPVPESTSVRVTRPVAVDRSRAYDDVVVEHARLNGVRADLVRAVVQVESAFNPLARSPKGALGLMQLMPAIIREFGVKNPFNPADNIRAGVAYLKRLLDRYQNNETLALAAYNAGPKAVDSHGYSIPPYRETRRYVALISQMSGAAEVTRIFKITEIVDGLPIVRYTDQRPASGTFEVITVR